MEKEELLDYGEMTESEMKNLVLDFYLDVKGIDAYDAIHAFQNLREFTYNKPYNITKDLTVKEIAHKGGMDQGSEYYTIFLFQEENKEPVYVKFEGYYSSYAGVNYEEGALEKVKPVQKMITVYE